MKPPSKRFNPTAWSRLVVPGLLVLLLLGLLAVLLIISLSLLGVTPA